MEKKKIYPASVNTPEKEPFFHNIDPVVFKAVFSKKKEQPALYLYSLNNAYASPYGSVFKNGRVIRESIYQSAAANIRSNFFSFWNKIIRNKVRPISGDCVVVSHSWFQNYYHWMTEIVPRLFLMQEELTGKKLIIHKNLSAFHHAVLSKFNFKEIIYIEDHEIAKCEQLSFTSFPSHYTNRFLNAAAGPVKMIELNVNEVLMREMKRWFIDTNPLLKNNKEVKNSRIFISRKKAGYRKILNEAELDHILEKAGFVKIFLEDLSFDEQVQALYNANVVVAIHGAGLTNILFMQPHTHVINFISEAHHEFCYLTMAHIAESNYAHINCRGTKKENPAYNDITIDPALAQEVLHLITVS
ncbi:MAG: hypothetical protein JWP12_1126 [Bacteroidetes bacterium]|nr:hypothetical protein [Bacteroidota bacterium]